MIKRDRNERRPRCFELIFSQTLGPIAAAALAALGAFTPPSLLALGAILGTSLTTTACRSARKEAQQLARCSRQRPCRKPNVCLGEASGGGEGTCVHPCRSDSHCPAPFRCSGRFLLAGQTGQFCRKPLVPEGGDCSPIRQGCKDGLRCFRDRCHRLCEKEEDCPNQKQRCLQVLDSPASGAPATAQYRACLDAQRRQGELCDPTGPFCSRGNVCHNGRCLMTCTKDANCDMGQICDGSLYTGDQAKARAEAREEPDLLYCRQAGDSGAACNLRMDKSCQRGLFCLDSRCRALRHVPLSAECNELQGIFCEEGALCFAGSCRRPCDTVKDCLHQPGRKLRCQERLVHGKAQRICL